MPDQEGRPKVRFRLENERGVGLMEVMVSVVVFSIAIVFLYQMLFSGRMQVEFEGERRIATKAAEFKMEQLKEAGYGSTDEGSGDWESCRSLEANVVHPPNPQIVLDDRGTPEDPGDDLVGIIQWEVTATILEHDLIETDVKIVDLTIRWPENAVRDEVQIVTLVAK
jgi:prepilin-type N-terminal cleavage/methylation domain-containing protein